LLLALSLLPFTPFYSPHSSVFFTSHIPRLRLHFPCQINLHFRCFYYYYYGSLLCFQSMIIKSSVLLFERRYGVSYLMASDLYSVALLFSLMFMLLFNRPDPDLQVFPPSLPQLFSYQIASFTYRYLTLNTISSPSPSPSPSFLGFCPS
jgi:hypothetical protein